MLRVEPGPNQTIAPQAQLQRLSEWLRVLAEPNRLKIFNLLMDGVQCNCEIGDALQMAPNLISHHINRLRAAGLVETERDALDSRWIYYSINREALGELQTSLGLFFDPQRIRQRSPACGPRGQAACNPGDNEAKER